MLLSQHPSIKLNINYSSPNIKVITITTNISLDLIFDYCVDCKLHKIQFRTEMASVPQGMFAVRKVRQNMSNTWERSLIESRAQQRGPGAASGQGSQERAGGWSKPNLGKEWNFPKLNQQFLFTVLDHPPARYNSKLMNSIWGLYNRYSVHNLKKITGDNSVFGQQQNELMTKPSSGTPPVVASFSASSSRNSAGGGAAGASGGSARSAPARLENFLSSGYQH